MVKSIVTALMVAAISFSQFGYADQADSSEIFAQELAVAMQAWVSTEMESNDGKLLVTDPLNGEQLELTVVKLDTGDHLHPMSDTRFLSWGEFEDANGEAVFLDIFFVLQGDELVFDDEISIYSKGGVKRYSWDETGEYLKKLPLEADA